MFSKIVYYEKLFSYHSENLNPMVFNNCSLELRYNRDCVDNVLNYTKWVSTQIRGYRVSVIKIED